MRYFIFLIIFVFSTSAFASGGTHCEGEAIITDHSSVSSSDSLTWDKGISHKIVFITKVNSCTGHACSILKERTWLHLDSVLKIWKNGKLISQDSVFDGEIYRVNYYCTSGKNMAMNEHIELLFDKEVTTDKVTDSIEKEKKVD